jgi:hypothetical protein
MDNSQNEPSIIPTIRSYGPPGRGDWYVRSVEGRQAARDQFEREDRINTEKLRQEREALDRKERASHLDSLLTVAQIIIDIQREIEILKDTNTNQHVEICGKLNEMSECLERLMIVK